MIVTMRLDCVPNGQGRARTSTYNGWLRQHKADRDSRAESTIAALAAPYRPESPINGPVIVEIVAVMPRPAAMSKLSKRTGLPLNPGRYPHTSRPDADNCGKAMLDALKSWWRDDSQVCDLRVQKVVADVGEQPHWQVTLRWGD